MEKAVFTVKTGLSREDYRKFLYIDTFKKSVLIWPMIVLCSAMGSVLVAALIDNWNILVIVLIAFFMLALSAVFLCMRIERRCRRTVEEGKGFIRGTSKTLRFFDDHVERVNSGDKAKSEASYSSFFRVLESNSFFLLYVNANVAVVVRKKDISGVDRFRDFIKEKFDGKYKTV